MSGNRCVGGRVELEVLCGLLLLLGAAAAVWRLLLLLLGVELGHYGRDGGGLWTVDRCVCVVRAEMYGVAVVLRWIPGMDCSLREEGKWALSNKDKW